MPAIGLVEKRMSYMLAGAAIAVAGLVWLMIKSRQLTDAKALLVKSRAAARAQFLKGAGTALTEGPDRAASKRPKFGQR